MNSQSFNIVDGLPVSLFSMLVVFFILILLAVIISLLKYLPSKQEKTVRKNMPKVVSKPMSDSNPAASVTVERNEKNEEEGFVAMLVASCVAQESLNKDVRIISIEKVK